MSKVTPMSTRQPSATRWPTLAAVLSVGLVTAACNPQSNAPMADKKADAPIGSPSTTMDDAAITSSVKDALSREPTLGGMSVDVTTQQGRVMLKGKATDAVAAARAVAIVADVKGVQSVDNQLVVAPPS